MTDSLLPLSWWRHPAIAWLACLAVGLFSVVVFLKNAWVAEDAYILLRSVDQFTHGNGLRWNLHERAQVYTSPLWYLLVLFTTLFVKNHFLNLLLLSLVLHLALLGVMAVVLRDAGRWIIAVLLLTLSQAFFDFTTSGLEYPLVYFLLGTFVLLYVRNQHWQDRRWLMLCAGLVVVTRHDTLPLVLPALLQLAWAFRRQLTVWQAVELLLWLGAPAVAWTLFSVLYYGVPLPNTAYAKLSIPGLPQSERFRRGFIYMSVTARNDLITLAAIAMAIWRGFACGQRAAAGIALGLVLSFAYITVIGGDYMMGRFYAPLYVMAVLLLVSLPAGAAWAGRGVVMIMGICLGFLFYRVIVLNGALVVALFQPQSEAAGDLLGELIKRGSFAIALVAAGLAWLAPRSRLAIVPLFAVGLFYCSVTHNDAPWKTGYKDYGKTSDYDIWWMDDTVSRERYWIYRWTSLYAWWHRDPSRIFPDHSFCNESLAYTEKVQVLWVSGMKGYCMRLDQVGIDYNGLVSPLMARMPMHPASTWASGGALRIVPEGYLESLATGQNRIADPDLARYYDKLRIVTESEPLWTAERLRTILAFNLGEYDPWLQAYIERTLKNPPPLPGGGG